LLIKTYLVGGAVRDQLLGRTVKERDWVVVGETPASMLALGFLQVGKDFPVFLHPNTKEEYALARKERKTGKGYAGFSFDTSNIVTLEEDLSRRDLTINAIAQDETGKLIDPYGGVTDIQQQVLRHVSPAFIEDPVRILRLARFAARFSRFTIAEETQELMKRMVQAGEVDALVPERVWKEFLSALGEPAPWRFLNVLFDCCALHKLSPELYAVYSTACECLKKVSSYTEKAEERFVVMLQTMNTEQEIQAFCQSYRIPTALAWKTINVKTKKQRYLDIYKASAEDILETFCVLDAFRREARFEEWLRLCELTTMVLDEKSNKFITDCYRKNLHALQSLVIDHNAVKTLKGPAIANYIKNKRLERLKQTNRDNHNNPLSLSHEENRHHDK